MFVSVVETTVSSSHQHQQQLGRAEREEIRECKCRLRRDINKEGNERERDVGGNEVGG